MKKLFSIILALVMLLSFTACGGNNTDKPTNGSADIETSLFSLSYDDSVWTYYEEDTQNEEDYCYICLQIPNPDDPDYYLIEAQISVSLEEPYDFREDLVYYGFDQYEYAENNKYETTSIGGVDLLKYDDGGILKYFNRIENAGATVDINFDAEDTADSRIEELLKGLAINVEDTGNEDGPWEWEGTPFSASDASAQAGSLTIESKWIEIDEYISTFETFDHSVAAVDDTVYLLVDGELRKYTLADNKLTFVDTIELSEDDYTSIEATDGGVLWLSGSMNDVVCLKDETVSATHEDIYDLAMHPSGKWGIDYFTTSECEKITFNGSTYTSKEMVFSDVDTIMHINVDENNIYVCGTDADSNHKVFVYDADGKLQKTLSDAEGESLGSITFMAQSDNGYIGFDGNMRAVMLWDNDGKFVAEVDGDELFNAYYPWFCNSALLSDGSIITIMTEDRADKSATELVAFIVDGF